MKNVRVAKYQPFTFECIRCQQQFVASGKALKQMGTEVANHIKEKHPEVSHESTQKAAGAGTGLLFQ
jgi:translation elongation factor EF-Ts